MKERKRRLELYAFYDHTGIERHLEEMAADGWLLERVENNIWHYRRTQPCRLRFSVVYYPGASELDPEPSEKQRTFYDFCEYAGWHLAAASAQLQIFYNEDLDPLPIATDPALELEAVHRSAKRGFLPAIGVMLAVSLLLASMLVSSLLTDPIGLFSSASNLFTGFVWLLLLVYCASELEGYLAWYVRAKKAAARGEFLETSSRIWLAKLVLALVFLGFLYWLISWVSVGPLWRRGIGIAISAYMLVLFFLAGSVKSFFRRRKASPGLNRTLTLLVLFAVSFAFMALLTSAAVQTARNTGSQGAGGQAEELPLTAADLMEVPSDGYLYQTRESRSPLLEQLELSQTPEFVAEDAQAYPALEYRITLVKAPFLYGMCKNQLLKERDESGDDRVPEGYKRVYEERDPEIWSADEAYELTAQDTGAVNRYLLCYPDRIVEIWFSWELTEEQMRTAGEQLAG